MFVYCLEKAEMWIILFKQKQAPVLKEAGFHQKA